MIDQPTQSSKFNTIKNFEENQYFQSQNVKGRQTSQTSQVYQQFQIQTNKSANQRQYIPETHKSARETKEDVNQYIQISEVEYWKERCQQLEQQLITSQQLQSQIMVQQKQRTNEKSYNSDPQKVIRQIQFQLQDLQTKTLSLMNELERVNKALNQQNTRVIQFQSQLQEQNNNLQDFAQMKKIYQLREDELLKEVERLNLQIYNKNRSPPKQQIANELSSQLQIMTIELEKLHHVLKNKIDDYEDLKIQYNRLQSQPFQALLEVKTQELQVYKDKVGAFRELEQKLIYVTNELDRVNKIMRFKNEESEKMMLVVKQFEDCQMQVVTLQNSLEQLSLQIQLKQKQITNFQEEINRINLLQQQKNDALKNLEIYVKKLEIKLQEQKDEAEGLSYQNAKLRLSIGEQQIISEDAAALQIQLTKQNQILLNKENEMAHYKIELQKAVSKNQDLLSDVSRSKEALNQMNEYKQKCEQMDQIQIGLDDKNHMFENLFAENKQMQIHFKEFQTTIQALVQERKRLVETIRLKVQEYEAQKSNFQQFQIQQAKVSEQLIIIPELQQEIEQGKQKSQRLEMQYQQTLKDIKTISEESEAVRIKFQRQQQEIQREFNQDFSVSKLENGSLRQKNKLLETQIGELQMEMEQKSVYFERDIQHALQQQAQSSRYQKTEEYNQLRQQYDQLNQKYNQVEQHFISAQQQQQILTQAKITEIQRDNNNLKQENNDLQIRTQNLQKDEKAFALQKEVQRQNDQISKLTYELNKATVDRRPLQTLDAQQNQFYLRESRNLIQDPVDYKTSMLKSNSQQFLNNKLTQNQQLQSVFTPQNTQRNNYSSQSPQTIQQNTYQPGSSIQEFMDNLKIKNQSQYQFIPGTSTLVATKSQYLEKASTSRVIQNQLSSYNIRS